MPEVVGSSFPRHIEVIHRRRPSQSFGAFVTELSNGYVCDPSPEREAIVLGNQECRQIICNDGSWTYAVHSTTVDKARQIMQEGLASPGIRDVSKGWDIVANPSRPHFGRTLVLLAGPKEKDQTRINMHALAYEYQPGMGNNAKVVFAFPVSHDSEPNYLGFDIDKTFLGQADGAMVIREPNDDALEVFRIAPDRGLGYFDFGQNAFVQNESFVLHS
jgi:hypothetical protein